MRIPEHTKTAYVVEYERPKYHGIVFRRSAFSKNAWAEILRRCGVFQYEAADISSISIDTDDYGQCLVLNITIDRKHSMGYESGDDFR